MPIGDKDQWIPDGEMEDVKVAPPIQKRSAGRPKMERFPSVGEFKRKTSSNRCRRCGKAGHNRKACTNPYKVVMESPTKNDGNMED